jgi:hypothetical protein
MAWFIDSLSILLFACVLLPIIIYVSTFFWVSTCFLFVH